MLMLNIDFSIVTLPVHVPRDRTMLMLNSNGVNILSKMKAAKRPYNVNA